MSDETDLTKDVPISAVDSPSVVLEMIYQLKIRDVMRTNFAVAKPVQTMREIQKMMKENFLSGIPIIENNKILGIVSTEDIIIALDEGKIDSPVEERMSRQVIVLEGDMPLSFAISYLNRYHYGRFPVVNKQQELVGTLSSKDVIRALLVEMNREVQRLEKINQHDAPVPDMYSEMIFTTVRHDFELAGKASTEIKKALKARNMDPKIIRRIAIASYELEINQVVHSLGGKIHCSIEPKKITIVAKDTGPGIEDVNLVLQEGWSTANEWIRSLGFGAGMGLPNTKRVSDEFRIESTPGVGTTVSSVVFINPPEAVQK